MYLDQLSLLSQVSLPSLLMHAHTSSVRIAHVRDQQAMPNSAPLRLHAAIHRLHTYAELLFCSLYACSDLPAHRLLFFLRSSTVVPRWYFMTPLVAVQASHASR